ncbi:hypothetical protein [Ferdinandcohnia sp. Marseille-Q9671]
MESLIQAFKENYYELTRETTKSIEFVHTKNGGIIYLLPFQEATIAVHPAIVEANQNLLEKSAGYSHNTSFREFPKRQNTGKGPIQYGYSFKFQSAEELSSFLKGLYVG